MSFKKLPRTPRNNPRKRSTKQPEGKLLSIALSVYEVQENPNKHHGEWCHLAVQHTECGPRASTGNMHNLHGDHSYFSRHCRDMLRRWVRTEFNPGTLAHQCLRHVRLL